jgi:hypothetical protein
MMTLYAGLAAALLSAPPYLAAYPLDAYPETGIRRLDAAQRVQLGELRGTPQPPGALLHNGQVKLHLLGGPPLELPAPDPEFTAQIRGLLGTEADRYGIAVLDLSDPRHPRYAEHRGDDRNNPGSVGKLVVALALFQALADIYPGDLEARRRILRDTVVTADAFIHWDEHRIRLWNPATGRLSHRPLREGDQASLWEYLDWMLSASSNAAAAMVMKHLILMVQYGPAYPPSREEADRFFAQTPRGELAALLTAALTGPVTRNGLDVENLRQGKFFTKEGKRRVPATNSSVATARELMRWLLKMEEGRLVDAFSSRELKRLLYMTERRIRYASSPALAKAAVYFKSGSLYSCRPEPGFTCRKYHGNVRNLMNSVAIVESPAQEPRQVYMVTVMSNVLRKNSAVVHQTLATRIQRLIERAHPLPQPGGNAR